jgi:hypothetical protein
MKQIIIFILFPCIISAQKNNHLQIIDSVQKTYLYGIKQAAICDNLRSNRHRCPELEKVINSHDTIYVIEYNCFSQFDPYRCFASTDGINTIFILSKCMNADGRVNLTKKSRVCGPPRVKSIEMADSFQRCYYDVIERFDTTVISKAVQKEGGSSEKPTLVLTRYMNGKVDVYYNYLFECKDIEMEK